MNEDSWILIYICEDESGFIRTPQTFKEFSRLKAEHLRGICSLYFTAIIEDYLKITPEVQAAIISNATSSGSIVYDIARKKRII